MNRAILAALVAVLVSGPAWAKEEFLLTCQMADGFKHYFSVILDDHKVKFMTTDEVRVGEVSVHENNYVLHFPQIKEEHWEIVIMVNRYSGEIVWEHGRPPFGKLNLKNVHRSGKCEKGGNKPLF